MCRISPEVLGRSEIELTGSCARPHYYVTRCVEKKRELS